MTIDERLEKLAERHESLAHAVELLAPQSQATDERINNLGKFVTELATGTARLLRVAEAHEQQITGLEGQL